MYRILFFLLIFAGLSVNARQIIPEEALQVAIEFFNDGSPASSPCHLRHLKRTENANKVQPYYVFNDTDNGGFVIVSGDDRTKKILGYSDIDTFDLNNLPPQVNDMLDNFANMLVELPENAMQDQSWSEQKVRSTGGVLLNTAKWGQGYPYNTQCPVINGVHAVTGCMPTAMAIIMKYHNWPPKSIGSSYWDQEKMMEIAFNDFYIDYDWSSMLDEYSTPTQEKYDEVAKLMHTIGVSLACNYGIEETGSWDFTTTAVFRHIFRYPGAKGLTWKSYRFDEVTGVNEVTKDYYTYDEWVSIIRNEIDNGRPIYYQGMNLSNYASHSFVCSGYDENDYFYFNWGWDGIANGYYALSASSTNENNLLFPDMNVMIIGLCPDDEPANSVPLLFFGNGSYVGENNTDIAPVEPMSVSTNEVKKDTPFSLGINNLCSRDKFEAEIGLALCDRERNILELASKTMPMQIDYPQNFGNVSITMDNIVFHSDITPDLFLIPVYRRVGDSAWQFVAGFNGNNRVPVKKSDVLVNLEISDNLCVRIYDEMMSSYISLNNEDELVGLRADSYYTVEVEAGDYNKNYFIENSGKGHVEYCYYYFSDGKEYFARRFYVNRENSFDFKIYTADHSKLRDISVECRAPGDLLSIISDYQDIGSLKISGEIDHLDYKFAVEQLNNLHTLDCRDAKCNSLGYYTPSPHIQNLFVPSQSDFSGNYDHMYRLRFIYYPSTVSTVSGSFVLSSDHLHTVIVMNNTPPIVINNWGLSYIAKPTLVVPDGCKEIYKESPFWSEFENIVELSCYLNGIDNVPQDSYLDNVSVYDLNGVKVYEGLLSGMNVVKGLYIVVSKKDVYKYFICD